MAVIFYNILYFCSILSGPQGLLSPLGPRGAQRLQPNYILVKVTEWNNIWLYIWIDAA